MQRDYMLVSPSLDGVFNHDNIAWEGIERPEEIIRIFDGPISKSPKGPSKEAQSGRTVSVEKKTNAKELAALEKYFQDLYGIFMKNISQFAANRESSPHETVKLQAMLQEMIKVKKWLS